MSESRPPCPGSHPAMQAALAALVEICQGDFDAITAEQRIKAASAVINAVVMITDIQQERRSRPDG